MSTMSDVHQFRRDLQNIIFRCDSISRSRGASEKEMLKIGYNQAYLVFYGLKHLEGPKIFNNHKVSNDPQVFNGFNVFNNIKVFNSLKVLKSLNV